MSIAGTGLDVVIENLNQLCSHQPHLIANAREKIDNLKLELEYLKSEIGNFSRYIYGNIALKEIRGVVDETEDAVDTYTVMASVQKSKGWISKTFHRTELRDAEKRIARVADKVKQINEKNILRAGVDAPQSQLALIPHVYRASQSELVTQVQEDNVIGFGKPAADVEKLLVEGPEKFEVITIAGMSGLGKTTLAKKVYKDPGVDYEYMIRGFVYVSRQYGKKDVLLQILRSFSRVNDEVMEKNEKDLEKYVCKELEGKQYLIVLDDVWEPKDWDALKGAFPHNEKRCRVLITTTNARVAEHANPTNPDSLYMLDFLRPEYSEELLLWRVFHTNNSPDEIKSYVVKIAEKCVGLPLAIVIIAGILVNYPSRVDWWEKVTNGVHNYLSRDVSRFGIIEKMYEHLPDKLKPCFLYLGVFRGDYEIPVWKLVRLWISEGFIDEEENLGLELEDVAERYLEELVQRNLVIVGLKRSNGKMKTCRLHDTLHEFCKKEANEDNLSQDLNRQNISGNTSLDNCRRLCINDPVMEDYMSGPVSGKRVRSFLTFQKADFRVEPKHVSFIPKTLKLLKVLEAQSLIFTRFPTDLSHLILLKYLAISSTISTIPPSFCSLWNLQTLIVNTDSRTLEVKMDLWKMSHFRHFHSNATASFPSPDTKSQNLPETNVRTLCNISAECCKVKVLARTPRLKKLGICGNLAYLFATTGENLTFVELNDLENLKLVIYDIDRNLKLHGLPSHTRFPPHLTKLTLMNTRLEWKEMSTLGKLEKLEILKLKEYAFQGYLWNDGKGGFNNLVHLFIGQTDLVVWEAAKEHFPKLKNLELNGCDKLKSFPHGLADIPSLQSIVLYCTNPQVASSARRLQILKLEQARKGERKSFRLSVYPHDH